MNYNINFAFLGGKIEKEFKDELRCCYVNVKLFNGKAKIIFENLNKILYLS